METRDAAGLWKKGVSGNPNGRPKQNVTVKAIAREHTDAAIAALVANLSHENGSVVNQAAIALLDRGYGKPAQAVVGGDDDDNPLRIITRVERIIVDSDANSQDSNLKDFPPAT